MFDENDIVKKIETLDQYKFDHLISVYGGGTSTSSVLISIDPSSLS